MLRSAKQSIGKTATRQAVSLIVFTVGGKAFAMKAEEVGGVESWPASMPVPGTTPYLRELVRRGRAIHAVYDLAGQWSLAAEETSPLCLLAKWGASEVALRVDSQIPSLETADVDMIQPATGSHPGLVGTWTHQGMDIPLLSFRQLEQQIRQAA